MTDKEIIESLQNDRYDKAIKGLYSLFPSIKKYVIANNGSAEDARDIFQDALVILHKKVRDTDFTLAVPLQHYLFGISKNCWLAELRRQKKMPFVQQDVDVTDYVSDDEPDYNLANAAFNLLGEKCRQLLILFYFKKQSYKEIAGELSFNDEKVAKNQKYRCIQKAKEIFLTISNKGTHE